MVDEYTLDNMWYPYISNICERICIEWDGQFLPWYRSGYWSGVEWLVEPLTVEIRGADLRPGATRNPTEPVKNSLVDELQPVFNSSGWVGVKKYIEEKHSNNYKEATRKQLKKDRIWTACVITSLLLMMTAVVIIAVLTMPGVK